MYRAHLVSCRLESERDLAGSSNHVDDLVNERESRKVFELQDERSRTELFQDKYGGRRQVERLDDVRSGLAIDVVFLRYQIHENMRGDVLIQKRKDFGFRQLHERIHASTLSENELFVTFQIAYVFRELVRQETLCDARKVRGAFEVQIYGGVDPHELLQFVARPPIHKTRHRFPSDGLDDGLQAFHYFIHLFVEILNR
jgi:hypothetical protein